MLIMIQISAIMHKIFGTNFRYHKEQRITGKIQYLVFSLCAYQGGSRPLPLKNLPFYLFIDFIFLFSLAPQRHLRSLTF